jgi:trafficking protein particle complex subunit 11
MSQTWTVKHQHHLPSAVITLLPLTGEPNTSSLLDNKVKSEINGLKASLSSTNYKIRLFVLLLGTEDIEEADLEDRIATIRRTTGLDQKVLHFVSHNASVDQVADSVERLFNALYPQSLEYYRDLSKHARRKRNRNNTPQPTIAPVSAHVLTSQGWIVRYEFKLGLFAEFRQEIEAACRNYETAYDALFAAEVIESIASWSPRFNEARLLADVIALRIIRCLLMTGQIPAAVRAWTGHRDRSESLVNRRGKGTANYGWEAWQCTWSKTMAELISRANVAGLSQGSTSLGPGAIPIFAMPDKISDERFSPWEHLHHEGYWLKKAYERTRVRRQLANEIPDEDRQPPGRSPASKLAHNVERYDTYLTLEPYQEVPVDNQNGFDYTAEMVSILKASSEHFMKRSQLSFNDFLVLDQCMELLQSEAWDEALTLLRPLWNNAQWRRAGWWRLLQPVGVLLLECARSVKDFEVIVGVTWELANDCFLPDAKVNYDLGDVLTASAAPDKVYVALSTADTASRVVASFTFSSGQGHVGEPMEGQLVLTSCAMLGSPEVVLSEVKVGFEGSLKPVHIVMAESSSTNNERTIYSIDVPLEDSTHLATSRGKRISAGQIASASGHADLRLSSGQTRIFNIQVIPREAGEVAVAFITMMMEQEAYSLTITHDAEDLKNNQWWESKAGEPYCRQIGSNRVASTMQVMPKPPKVDIIAKDFKKSYYTNEEITITVDITNNEEETVLPIIKARLISPVTGAASIHWLDQQSDERTERAEVEQILPTRKLDGIKAGSTASIGISIHDVAAALDHELEIEASYSLLSDSETMLQRNLTLDVAVIRPFEANYDFIPRLTIEPWPNYFAPPSPASDIPSGLTQRYSVLANLFSFAIEPVEIEAILLTTTKISGGAVCSSTTGVLKEDAGRTAPTNPEISTSIAPEQTCCFGFDLTVQKQILGDRHTVALDLALEIGWRRTGSERVNTTILEVPRFVIPMAEPRVLLTVDKTTPVPHHDDMSLLALRYTIENPSMHFLTFNIAMEASEDFAFSGPKASAVSLVPISKYETVYRVLPNRRDTESSRELRKERTVKGEWIKVSFNVVDAYFNQTLRVQPAGDGVRLDKKGAVLVRVD